MQIELEILKNVQRCHFPEEFKVLSKSKNVNCVKKSSSLWSLDSVLVDSLLRVGCSLASASIPMESKHQIILPKKDHVTNLMAKHYHIISGYSGREYVLSVLHKRFWVIKLLEEFFPNGDKDKACFACRRWLIFQQLVILDKPPFTYISKACFGPLWVCWYQSLVKRYRVYCRRTSNASSIP